jgi:hypothetical protein
MGSARNVSPAWYGPRPPTTVATKLNPTETVVLNPRSAHFSRSLRSPTILIADGPGPELLLDSRDLFLRAGQTPPCPLSAIGGERQREHRHQAPPALAPVGSCWLLVHAPSSPPKRELKIETVGHAYWCRSE